MAFGFSAGQQPTAGQINDLLPLFAYKTADESLTSNTTNQDDDHLVLTVAANTVYTLYGVLKYSADSAADLKMGFVGPTGATLDWGCHGLLSTATGISGSVAMDAQAITQTAFLLGGSTTGNTQLMIAVVFGLLITSATAGTFKLQWAQSSSNATATIMRAGSFLKLNKCA